ncbi:MAG TPA: hypothetical protein VFM25_06540 [Verrucomicrobiae bacterium]|nr:hypothetical protein [Verrucomicrobiae bacterium]
MRKLIVSSRWRMRTFFPLWSLCLIIILSGCATSRVFQAPFAEVKSAVDRLQPEIVREMSPECERVGLLTNYLAEADYEIRIQDTMLPAFSPYLQFRLRRESDTRTKVTVVRVAKNPGASIGLSRRHDLERKNMNDLAEELEKKN